MYIPGRKIIIVREFLCYVSTDTLMKSIKFKKVTVLLLSLFKPTINDELFCQNQLGLSIHVKQPKAGLIPLELPM